MIIFCHYIWCLIKSNVIGSPVCSSNKSTQVNAAEILIYAKLLEGNEFSRRATLNLNSLLVKRQIDNPSPGAVTGGD